MATAGELVFEEQVGHLQEIAASREWPLESLERAFRLGLEARDDSEYWLLVDCNDYPVMPPAWHWINPATGRRDQLADIPKGHGFLHGAGCICAPWNRLAYKNINPKGPHADWDLANWMTNPKTGRCTTLAAMALRIQVELNSNRYQGRMG